MSNSTRLAIALQCGFLLPATPWQLSDMEQLLYGFTPGHDYPLPVVDLKTAAEQARERLWGQRQERDVQLEGMRILAKHVRSTHKDRWHGS